MATILESIAIKIFFIFKYFYGSKLDYFELHVQELLNEKLASIS